MQQFTAIRALQSRHGWKSTFFLLEDQYWKKKGGRYRWDDSSFSKIADFLLADGCELGIHGSAYSHDQPKWWVQKRERFQQIFGVPALGTRNHYLSLHVPDTWRAQQQAGMVYDATLGYPNRLGAPGGYCFPFDVASLTESPKTPLVQLPLTIMDVTLFRYLALDKEAAIEAAQEQMTRVRNFGGLVSVLWHNNFFAEPEYSDWEETYATILDWLAPQNPWVATGIEIAQWWKARANTDIEQQISTESCSEWTLQAQSAISNLQIEVFGMRPTDSISVDLPGAVVIPHESGTSAALRFPRLTAGQRAGYRVQRNLMQ
jgi:hypothetical protein